MSILLIAQNRDMKPVRDTLLREDPDLEVELWPAVRNPGAVQFAIAWNQPGEVFRQFPNLKAVSSFGAGADHLLSDPAIPPHIDILRLETDSIDRQMADYVEGACLQILRSFSQYMRQQMRGEWNQLPHTTREHLTIGILGLGRIGSLTARELANSGWNVSGWARSEKSLEGVRTFHGASELSGFLSATRILVCLLPLTNETEGILNLELFKKLKRPAHLINAGRGAHLVEEDLIYALDTGILQSATLDVFLEEPLPDTHPFWNRERVTITPHIAAITEPEDVAGQIVENYKRVISGMKPLHVIDRSRGY
ncbi:MAG: glyoxylate/hydroxypyruvate reductase A [Balneolaceae bacterium]